MPFPPSFVRAFPRFRGFDSAAEAAAAALDLLAADGGEDRRTVAVPGGVTGGVLADALARRPDLRRRLRLIVTDERWVPLADPRSNEGDWRRRLDEEDAPDGGWLSWPAAGESPVAAAAAMAAGLPRLDAAVLGVGTDGHVASLFPGGEWAAGPERACVATVSPGGGPQRVSLSLAAIRRARRLVLLFGGAEKIAAFSRAAEHGILAGLPVGVVLGERPDAEAVVFADAAQAT